MNSPISLIKIMRQDMRHRGWMLALSILFSTLGGPVVGLIYRTNIMTLSYLSPENKIMRQLDFFTNANPWICLIIAFAGALIVAVAGFRHLFSRKMVDLYHSAPVTRNELFTAIYLNGFLIWFLPFLGSQLILYLLYVIPNHAYAGAFTAAIFTNFWRTGLYFLMIYHLTLLMTMLCGTLLSTLVSTLFTGSCAALCYGCLYLLGMAHMKSFDGLPISLSAVSFLSPLFAPFYLLFQMALPTGDKSGFLLVYLGSILLLIVNLCLAAYCYKKRPSEQAEAGMLRRNVSSLLRISVGLLSGIYLALLLEALVGSFGSQSTAASVLWTLFGILLGGILSMGIMDIVLDWNIRSFWAHKLQIGGTLVAIAILYYVSSFDPFGFDSRLPDKSSIESASLYLTNFNEDLYLDFSTDQVYTINNRDLQERFVLTDKDLIYTLLADGVHHLDESELQYPSTAMHIKVKTKLGTYYRQYRLTQDSEEAIIQLINNKDYLNTFFPFATGQYPMPTGLELSDLAGDWTRINVDSPKLLQEFYTAYCQDFSLHHSYEDMMVPFYCAHIEALYSCEYENTTTTHYHYVSIGDNYENTISFLKQNFPDMIWSLEDAGNYTINFRVIDEYLSSAEALYSYFGVPGYPDFDTYRQEQALEDDSPYPTYYQITLPEDADLTQLAPYLHVGYPNYHCARALMAGSITPEGMNHDISTYILPGELPKEIIDQMIITQEESASKVDYVDYGDIPVPVF